MANHFSCLGIKEEDRLRSDHKKHSRCLQANWNEYKDKGPLNILDPAEMISVFIQEDCYAGHVLVDRMGETMEIGRQEVTKIILVQNPHVGMESMHLKFDLNRK